MGQVRGERPNPDDSTRYGYIFGKGGSGTFAMILDPDGDPIAGPPGPGQRIPPGLPYQSGITAAAATGRDVQTTTLADTPVRILTETVDVPNRGTYTVQIVQDRTTEQQTLEVIQFVLIVGGVLVLIVSFGFGAVYARRALVPIRESLASQRSALRRQREFAADASHELRTPLTVIRSSVDHLKRHRDEPVATVGDALEDIDDEVSHMTSIVEDLLLLARSDSGAIALERIPVDLGDVAADGALALGKPATDRGIRVDVDPQPAVVAGDPARLRQLVMILVDNAIRHSPADGRVGVADPGDRQRRGADGRGRRAGHPAGGPAARVRAVLPGAGCAGRRDRPGAGHRGLDRRSARRPDRGRPTASRVAPGSSSACPPPGPPPADWLATTLRRPG